MNTQELIGTTTAQDSTGMKKEVLFHGIKVSLIIICNDNKLCGNNQVKPTTNDIEGPSFYFMTQLISIIISYVLLHERRTSLFPVQPHTITGEGIFVVYVFQSLLIRKCPYQEEYR